MLYFTGKVFRRLAYQNRGDIRVMLEYIFKQNHFNLYAYEKYQ